MLCLECDYAPISKPDPRVPPLDTGDCLCQGCFEMAVEQLRDEALETVEYCDELLPHTER
jgi:hypothetical protein